MRELKSCRLKASYPVPVTCEKTRFSWVVPLARIPKRLRFYEDAAKIVSKRMVPNFKQSFERAVRR